MKEKLLLTRSPAQIAKAATLGKVSFKTIYNWMYQETVSLDETGFRHKGNRRYPPEKRGKFAVGLSNGVLRKFYPKKTDLSLVDEKELIHNLFLINLRPRKFLGWKSAIEVFFTRNIALDLIIRLTIKIISFY